LINIFVKEKGNKMENQNISKDQRLQVLNFLEKKRDSYPLYSQEWLIYNEQYLNILITLK